jgi:hypothetical protein
MSMGTKQVALTTTAAKVADGHVAACVVKVRNTHATIAVYVGGIGVTSATGYYLPPVGGEVTLTLGKNSADLYAVAASGTPSVSVLRVV